MSNPTQTAAFEAALDENYEETARLIRDLTPEQRKHMANQMDALRYLLDSAE
ncbi:hypothetical protein ACFY8X_38810 [Streptomyces tanashiensis]|uniref:hypothetical protein n=1 Tax=Streptomyces tanashiensis TaxID=67367 RepID=UPI0036F14337